MAGVDAGAACAAVADMLRAGVELACSSALLAAAAAPPAAEPPLQAGKAGAAPAELGPEE